MTNEQMIDELKAIIVYANAIKREQNRGIIKILVRDEIAKRANRLIEYLEGLE